MSKFFDDTMQGLLEAVAIDRGILPVEKKEGMSAPTFVAADAERELIDEAISLRKELNISQKQLAELTGNRQQAISRMENKENSPSLKLFCNMLNAIGYELQIVKKI